jgi:tripartite-type tricarboxylate transporter receptor subunit TctC
MACDRDILLNHKRRPTMLRRQFLQVGTVMASPWLVPGIHAQTTTYPDRPIKLLQGFAAGGNADAIARAVGNEMAGALGQPVVVEAQPGAGGTIAANTVARSRPDGHTLLLATGGHTAAGAIYRSLPYRTVEDFDMVSTITFFPFLLVALADAKPATLVELLTQARAQPGKIAYGTAGIGSTHHLAGELLASLSKTQLLHVPYRGDAASLPAVLGGEVPFIIAPPTAVLSNIKAGRLRAIATTGPQRWPGLPDVPTVAEQGVEGYDVRSWAGLMAPAGTPRPIVDRLNAEVLKALQLPAVRSRLEEMGGEVRGSTPEEMKAMVSEQTQKWRKIVAEANIPQQ